MKQKKLWLALSLALALTACAPDGTATQNTQPIQSMSASIPEAADEVEITSMEQVRGLYGTEYVVETVTRQENGWLVEYYQNTAPDVRELDWVFPSGWRTHIGTFESLRQYVVTGPAEVTVYTQGGDIFGTYLTMPQETVFYIREGDQYAADKVSDLYLPLTQDWTFGGGGRLELLYQARVGLTGLECSFMAPVDTMEHVMFFYTAATAIPRVETSFDADSRIFTIRMTNTLLSSGEIPVEVLEDSRWINDGWGEMVLSDLYPHSIPEGGLETESRWITDARLTQDGEDALITLTLSPEVVGYRLEAGNLGDDDMPYFNLEFTRVEQNLFPSEYLLN